MMIIASDRAGRLRQSCTLMDENGGDMENEKPWWAGRFESEEQVREVFKGWKDLLKSSVGWDEEKVVNLLAIINQYADLDIYPFITSCLDHSSSIVRLSATSALADHLSMSLKDEGIDKLRNLMQDDLDPHVRGVAAHGFGRIVSIQNVPGVISILLSMIRDSNEDNIVRVSAYKGIIYAFRKEGEPEYHPFNIRLNEPADEQIDWDWIDELTEKYVDNQDDQKSDLENS